MGIASQAQLLARMLGSAFNLGDLSELRLHFQDGQAVEWVASGKQKLSSGQSEPSPANRAR
ncbi:MAG: hypothetical protein NW237_14660 [Cyanobacteriota bacterium]|nr:hypothetical protein [Cyanobacteriota bacterium]